MSAADRVRRLTTAVAERDVAPPAAAEAATDEPERLDSMRVNCDLPPDRYHLLLKWILDAAQSTGRGVLTRQEALYWTIEALQDPVVSRHVRGLIAKPPHTAPVTRPQRSRRKGGEAS